MIFQILGFLLSAIGMFVFLLGVLSFLVMFTVPAITGVGRRLTDLYIWLALWCLNRTAIVVSEVGELLLKPMKFDDLGVEKIKLGSETKDFEDPSMAFHNWKGFPFALADEVHGILFDPRHAAIGEKKREYDEKDLGAVRASESDWKDYHIDEWLPGVFEFAKDHRLVKLGAVRRIVDGGERAEYPERVETIYEKSQLPFSSRMESLRLLIPIGAFFGVIILWWQLGSRAGSGGGGGGTSVSYGVITLLFATTGLLPEDVKKMLKVGVVAFIPLVVFGLIALATNIVFAIVVFVIYLMGFFAVPLMTVFAKASSKLSAAFAGFYLRLGLLGYDRPVLEWTQRSYRLREFDELETDEESVKWYSLAGSQIGFTFKPSEESFGADVVDRERLQSGQLVTDGGEDDRDPEGIPPNYVRCPALKRDIYGGYVPKNLNRSKIYLHSGIALSRMNNAAIGEKSLRRLLYSKQKYGAGTTGVADKTILYASIGCIIIGSAIGLPVFVL